MPREHRDPTVSAVIPAYNAAGTVERALASVLAQTSDRIIEIIVVDDGSDDGTAEVVRGAYPDVKLIQQENAGASAARNRGVREARGEYVAFLDADDEWLPGKIETQLEYAREHPGVVLWGCDFVEVPPGEGTSKEVRTAGTGAVNMVCFRDLFPGGKFPAWANTPGWLLPRARYLALGGLDERLPVAEDRDFLMRLTGRGFTLAVVGEALVRVHVRSDSLSRSQAAQSELCRLNLEILRRWDPDGDGWRSELLTPEQYRGALWSACRYNAWRAWDVGDRELAAEYLRRAAELSDSRGLRRLRERLAAWNPALYHALSRLRVRRGVASEGGR
ncbi:MAG: glycosyltransferase family 2 protein [Armatimonadota bacterium]